MRKTFITCLLLSFFATAFSQQTEVVTPALSKDDYLKKSKKQKITGFIMIGVGITCFAIASQADNSNIYGAPNAQTVWILGGVVSSIIGITKIINSGKNKRRARAMST